MALQDLFLFNKGINTSSDVNTVKIQILDKIAKLQSKYNMYDFIGTC